MLKNQQVAFIGGGHIAEIIIQNLAGRGQIKPENIHVSDPNPARCEHLSDRYGVSIAQDNAAAAQKGILILICVRPEVVQAVLPDLRTANLRPDQVVISVAAGVPLRTYQSLGAVQALVRALPNPPSQVGEGIAPLVFSSSVTEGGRQLVSELFSALGGWVEVEESYLNAITSLSSPVSTYLFFQSMIEAGLECGLPEKLATQIAGQTISGSMAVWRSRDASPAELIAQASTPGGVSVESLRVLEERDFPGAVVQAIVKGAARAAELGTG